MRVSLDKTIRKTPAPHAESAVTEGLSIAVPGVSAMVPPAFKLNAADGHGTVQKKDAKDKTAPSAPQKEETDHYSKKYPNLDSLPSFVERDKGENFSYSIVASKFYFLKEGMKSILKEMEGLHADKSLLEELSQGIEDMENYLPEFMGKEGYLDDDDLIYAEDLADIYTQLAKTLMPEIEAVRSKNKQPTTKKEKPKSTNKKIFLSKHSLETLKVIKEVEGIGSQLEKTLIIGTSINTATSLADPAEGLYMVLTLDDPFTPVAKALSDIKKIKHARIVQEISYLLVQHGNEMNADERQYWKDFLARLTE